MRRGAEFADQYAEGVQTVDRVSSVKGEDRLQAYMQVQQVPNDTDPLMWWKQHQQEFPDLSRMARQYLAVPATSVSPERFFSRVGLVLDFVFLFFILHDGGKFFKNIKEKQKK